MWWVLIFPDSDKLLLATIEQYSPWPAVDGGESHMPAFRSFSCAGLGKKEHLETAEEKGGMWGSGGWRGDLESKHSREAVFSSNGLFSICMVPHGKTHQCRPGTNM